MRIKLIRLLVKILYTLMLPGTSYEVWKWKPEGNLKPAGNAFEYTVPRNKFSQPVWRMTGNNWDALEYLTRGNTRQAGGK